jgi:Zn-dependent protease
MDCFLIVTIGWIFSVCLHEFGHAWVAWHGGDYTVKEKGYLTFNPFRYAHPVYSVLMPVVFLLLGGIGLPGGAVYINHQLLRSKLWDTGVSLAGPATNLVLILLIGAGFRIGLIPDDPSNVLSYALAFLLHLEVWALLLNLLPVPPLDGFQAIAPWLPPHIRQQAYGLANPALLILFVVLWNDNIVRNTFWEAVTGLTSMAGADPYLVARGARQFFFWR